MGSTAPSWKHVKLTVPAPSGFSVNGDSGLRIYWALALGSNYLTSTVDQWIYNLNHFGVSGAQQIQGVAGATFEITGVQLEVGHNATEFEYRHYGEELALCQRYYFKTPTNNWMYALDNTNVYNRATIWHPVEMRANPSITWSPTVSGTSNGTQWGSTKKSILYVNSPGTIVSVNPGAEFSAEL